MSDYDISKHAHVRARQRGYRKRDLSFVLEHGTVVSSGILLTKRDVCEIEQQARQMIALARRLQGTYLPCEGSLAKTVFKLTPAQQSQLL